jgi:large subunit ribosomal protein L29
MVSAAELRELDYEELESRLDEYRRELLNLRFQLATGQLDNTARLGEAKKDVARVLTVLRDHEIALAEGRTIEPAPHVERPPRPPRRRRAADDLAEEEPEDLAEEEPEDLAEEEPEDLAEDLAEEEAEVLEEEEAAEPPETFGEGEEAGRAEAEEPEPAVAEKRGLRRRRSRAKAAPHAEAQPVGQEDEEEQ